MPSGVPSATRTPGPTLIRLKLILSIEHHGPQYRIRRENASGIVVTLFIIRPTSNYHPDLFTTQHKHEQLAGKATALHPKNKRAGIHISFLWSTVIGLNIITGGIMTEHQGPEYTKRTFFRLPPGLECQTVAMSLAVSTVAMSIRLTLQTGRQTGKKDKRVYSDSRHLNNIRVIPQWEEAMGNWSRFTVDPSTAVGGSS
ncbi:hypothetical protein DFH09DRAFT_1069337 [Mycena vulgaris]|nr:hypothetical protein DFH09DRAFT_1069337 [Mycena vulgaris]